MTGDGHCPPSPRALTRDRVIAATRRCVERWGMAKTSLEDVAVAAEVSRATVYRHFPGGRDQLITETVAEEVRAFLDRLEREVDEDEGIRAKLVHALVTGHRALGEHRLLHQVLTTEREALLTELAIIGPLVLDGVRTSMRRALADEVLRAGVDADEAADYLARLFLSYLGSPGGTDLDDPGAVDAMVRTYLIGGIVMDVTT